ncbi:hypothetical protein ID866_1891 [Astraeus odoratus]|nr:hypothetical protein ID866_1891 [Astraeus odoratus]
MRKEVRACRGELLQEVLRDLEFMATSNGRHFNNLVGLEDEYHSYHKTMTCHWEDLIYCNEDVLSHFKTFLKDLDRELCAKALPASILPKRLLYASRRSVS